MKLEAPGFGRVVLDGQSYDHDVVVCRGSVALRRKELSSSRKSLYGHTPLTLEELRHYLDSCRDARILVIGAGYYGDLPIEPDALIHALKRVERVVIAKTPDLARLGLDLSEVLAIIHVTC